MNDGVPDVTFSQDRVEVVFAGRGGQGIVLAGILLAEATLCCGRNVVQTQLYTPEMRGGESRSDVIISTRPIGYLRVYHPEVVVAFSQDAYDNLAPIMAPGGLCLAESNHVKDTKKIGALMLPMEERARETLGKKVFANVISLGVLSNFITFITEENFKQAIKRRVPERFLAQDIEAFNDGFSFNKWLKKK